MHVANLRPNTFVIRANALMNGDEVTESGQIMPFFVSPIIGLTEATARWSLHPIENAIKQDQLSEELINFFTDVAKNFIRAGKTLFAFPVVVQDEAMICVMEKSLYISVRNNTITDDDHLTGCVECANENHLTFIDAFAATVIL